MSKNQYYRAVYYGVLLGLLCQIYISPFAYSRYVVSLGTPVLSALLLFQPNLPIMPLMLVMTTVASVFRGLIGVWMHDFAFTDKFIPALIYYGIYSVLLSASFSILNRKGKFRLMAGMIFCDFAANSLQLVLMGHMEEQAILDAALVAVVRGLFVWGIYWMYEWELLYIRQKEHQNHYAQLNSIVTDIYAESFYLRKSMEDLNRLTRKSHQLYEDLEEKGENGQPALDIAREAHEIRKDYQRISQGIAALVRANEEKSMSLSNILQIIKDNTKRQMAERPHRLSFQVSCGTDMQIQKYYDIFTIINNLLVNSMDACQEGGKISLSIEVSGENLEIKVTDNGCGIEEDMLAYIWGAGFSTKYDQETGTMSTGIGLCHVKNVVEYLGGEAKVKSNPSLGTEFCIHLPLEQLR